MLKIMVLHVLVSLARLVNTWCNQYVTILNRMLK